MGQLVGYGWLIVWKKFSPYPTLGHRNRRTLSIRIIQHVLDKGEACKDDPQREKTLEVLNQALHREGWDAFYDDHNVAHPGVGRLARERRGSFQPVPGRRNGGLSDEYARQPSCLHSRQPRSPCRTRCGHWRSFSNNDSCGKWCRGGELNSRPHPYQGCALPLSYRGEIPSNSDYSPFGTRRNMRLTLSGVNVGALLKMRAKCSGHPFVSHVIKSGNLGLRKRNQTEVKRPVESGGTRRRQTQLVASGNQVEPSCPSPAGKPAPPSVSKARPVRQIASALPAPGAWRCAGSHDHFANRRVEATTGNVMGRQ